MNCRFYSHKKNTAASRTLLPNDWLIAGPLTGLPPTEMAKCRSNQTSRRVRDPDVSWWCGAGKERSGKRRRAPSGAEEISKAGSPLLTITSSPCVDRLSKSCTGFPREQKGVITSTRCSQHSTPTNSASLRCSRSQVS